MGMDIYGKHPDARVGEHLAYSRYYWAALVACIRDLAPSETSACENWLGKGCLGAEGSVALADRLDSLIVEGAVERYVARRNAFLTQHPCVACIHCEGSGTFAVGYCNRCDARGTMDTAEWYRDLYVSDVREFAEFLRHSGGFSLYWDVYHPIEGRMQLADFGFIRDSEGRLLG